MSTKIKPAASRLLGLVGVMALVGGLQQITGGGFDLEPGVIIALIALLGTALTGWWGYRQRKTVSGDTDLQFRQQFSEGIQKANIELERGHKELEKSNRELEEQNRVLTRQNAKLDELNQAQAEQIASLKAEAAMRTQQIAILEQNILSLNRRITQLEMVQAANDMDNGHHEGEGGSPTTPIKR